MRLFWLTGVVVLARLLNVCAIAAEARPATWNPDPLSQNRGSVGAFFVATSQGWTARGSRLPAQFGNHAIRIGDYLLEHDGAVIKPPVAAITGIARWYGGQSHTAARIAGSLRYPDLYPGIDLVFRFEGNTLKSDYVVAPGADPARIRFRYSGAAKIGLDRGDLVIDNIREAAPVAWQETDGNRHPVSAAYRLDGAAVTFDLGRWDHAATLVIDPYVVAWSMLAGGTLIDNASAMAVDSAGSIYVAGHTESADMFSGPVLARGGGSDAFVMKIDPAQNRVLWATYLGGSFHDEATAVASHPTGGIVVAGSTASANFPAKPTGMFRGGSSDAFVALIDSNGALVFANYLGGSGADKAFGAAVSPAGGIWATGETDSVNFPLQQAIPGASRGGVEAFATRFSATGSILSSTTFGGSASERGRAIATDSLGEVYITGTTSSGDFPTLSPFQPSSGGAPDAFVSKIAADGASFRYSSYLGGPPRDVSFAETGTAIAIDATGSAWVAGIASSLTFPLASPVQSTYGGGNTDGFLVRVSPAGSLTYSSYIGGNGSDEANGVAILSDGSVAVGGGTTSTDLALVGNAGVPSGASWDAFVQRLSSAGTSLLFSTYLSGSESDTITALAAYGTSIWVTGNSASQTFLPSGAPRGLIDAYVAELRETAATVSATIGAPAGKVWDVAGAGCEPGFYSGTRTLTWTAGASCTVRMYDDSTATTRHVMASWSDGSTANPRVFSAAAGMWTATYRTEYLVQATAGTGGTVAPGTSWIAAGAQLQLTATPAPGYSFSGWTGGLASNPATFTVNAPLTVSASFACSFVLGTNAATVGSAAAAVDVSVTTAAACSWSATSNAAWITLTNNAANSRLSISANSGAATRVGTVTVAGQTVTITQHGTGAVSVTFSPPADVQWSVAGTGCQAGSYNGSRTLSWTAGSQCTVTMQSVLATDTRRVFSNWSDGSSVNPRVFAATAATWGAAYRTEYRVQAAASAGGTASPALAWVTAGSAVQLSATPAAGFAFTGWTGGISGNPAVVAVNAPMSVTATFACAVSLPVSSIQAGSASSVQRVSATAACVWTASSSVPWITVSQTLNEVVMTIAENTGAARSATVTAGAGRIVVNQAAVCRVTPSRSALNPPAQGEYAVLSFTVSPAGCSWKGFSSADWVHVFPISGSGNGSVSLNVYAHFGRTARSATVTLGNTKIPVTQPGATGTVNERFAGLMYYNILGRLGSDPEIKFHAKTLSQGLTRKDVVYNFFNSEEFNRSGRFIAGLYVGLLNRDAEFSGWLFQRGALVTNFVDQNKLVENFLATPEYVLKFGSPSNHEFVRLLYRYILRREGSEGEVDRQAGRIPSLGRVQMAMNFLNSPEFRTGMGPRLTAFLLYSCILLRDGSPAERDALAAQVAAGTDLRQLMDSLLTLPEFEKLLN